MALNVCDSLTRLKKPQNDKNRNKVNAALFCLRSPLRLAVICHALGLDTLSVSGFQRGHGLSDNYG